jgi:hypothetical protein
VAELVGFDHFGPCGDAALIGSAIWSSSSLALPSAAVTARMVAGLASIFMRTPFVQ